MTGWYSAQIRAVSIVWLDISQVILTIFMHMVRQHGMRVGSGCVVKVVQDLFRRTTGGYSAQIRAVNIVWLDISQAMLTLILHMGRHHMRSVGSGWDGGIVKIVADSLGPIKIM